MGRLSGRVKGTAGWIWRSGWEQRGVVESREVAPSGCSEEIATLLDMMAGQLAIFGTDCDENDGWEATTSGLLATCQPAPRSLPEKI